MEGGVRQFQHQVAEITGFYDQLPDLVSLITSAPPQAVNCHCGVIQSLPQQSTLLPVQTQRKRSFDASSASADNLSTSREPLHHRQESFPDEDTEVFFVIVGRVPHERNPVTLVGINGGTVGEDQWPNLAPSSGGARPTLQVRFPQSRSSTVSARLLWGQWRSEESRCPHARFAHVGECPTRLSCTRLQVLAGAQSKRDALGQHSRFDSHSLNQRTLIRAPSSWSTVTTTATLPATRRCWREHEVEPCCLSRPKRREQGAPTRKSIPFMARATSGEAKGGGCAPLSSLVFEEFTEDDLPPADGPGDAHPSGILRRRTHRLKRNCRSARKQNESDIFSLLPKAFVDRSLQCEASVSSPR